MSGTRLLSPTAPVIDRPWERPAGASEVLLAAHGERGGAGDNRALLRLAARLARHCAFASVRAGVLKGEPSVERACAGKGPLQVYPLFMSDGYYVREALPERLRRTGREFRIHRPFGLEPGLAALTARHGAGTLRAHGEDPRESILLLVAHGSSKSDQSRIAAEWQAARLRRQGQFAEVRTAYLENPPFLPEALASLPAGPCVMVGFFSGEGRHAAEDLPESLAARGRAQTYYAGAITTAPQTADLIAASLQLKAVRA